MPTLCSDCSYARVKKSVRILDDYYTKEEFARKIECWHPNVAFQKRETLNYVNGATEICYIDDAGRTHEKRQHPFAIKINDGNCRLFQERHGQPETQSPPSRHLLLRILQRIFHRHPDPFVYED